LRKERKVARMIVLVVASLLVLVMGVGGQSGSDPYSLNLVSFELKMNSGGRRAVHSWSQKRLVGLGDGIGVAILKILEGPDLKNPETVRDFLPIIRDSFAQPQLISKEVDRTPKVTLFLLRYLQQGVQDSQVQQEIRQTIDFVEKQTTPH
jgi:hypothetical protein